MVTAWLALSCVAKATEKQCERLFIAQHSGCSMFNGGKHGRVTLGRAISAISIEKKEGCGGEKQGGVIGWHENNNGVSCDKT